MSKLLLWNPIFLVFALAACLNLLSIRRLRIPANCLGAIGILNFEYTRIFAGLYLILQNKDFLAFCRVYLGAMSFFALDLVFQRVLGGKDTSLYLLEVYCYFVLLYLVPKASFRSISSAPRVVAWSIVIGLILLDPFFSDRLILAFNPNVDAALLAIITLSLTSPVSAILSTILFFRSRSALLAVITACLPFNPRKMHFIQALAVPLLLQLLGGVFFSSSTDTHTGIGRFIPQMDQSAQYHAESIAEGIHTILGSPPTLLGNSGQASPTYLQNHSIYPHNALLYSVLSDGIFYSLATLLLLFRLYSLGSSASRKLILSWLVFCGFSDIGLDFFFVSGVCAAVALTNFGWDRK